MGRRGDPGPGVRCPLLGPVLPALLLTLLATACDATAAAPAAPGPTTPPRSAPPRTPRASHPPPPAPLRPLGLCTRLVSHWSRAVLDGTTYGDYQSMGLSNGQYAILREVVAAARVVKRRQGAAAARHVDRPSGTTGLRRPLPVRHPERKPLAVNAIGPLEPGEGTRAWDAGDPARPGSRPHEPDPQGRGRPVRPPPARRPRPRRGRRTPGRWRLPLRHPAPAGSLSPAAPYTVSRSDGGRVLRGRSSPLRPGHRPAVSASQCY
ncbi:hypothetical protein ACQ4WX_14980 [Streptomyces lasalocidi]